jgi:hypothetical protein
MELASRIVGFIQASGGAAGSQALVAHFGEVLQPSQMPLFKQLLRQVAQLQAPSGSGRGGRSSSDSRGGDKVWVLKEDYGAAGGAADGAA